MTTKHKREKLAAKRAARGDQPYERDPNKVRKETVHHFPDAGVTVATAIDPNDASRRAVSISAMSAEDYIATKVSVSKVSTKPNKDTGAYDTYQTPKLVYSKKVGAGIALGRARARWEHPNRPHHKLTTVMSNERFFELLQNWRGLELSSELDPSVLGTLRYTVMVDVIGATELRTKYGALVDIGKSTIQKVADKRFVPQPHPAFRFERVDGTKVTVGK
jgi:hypothetical protein